MSRWLEILAATEPIAHSRIAGHSANAAGGVAVGFQTVLHQGESAIPTIAVSYFHQVYGGNAPDIDIGSANQRECPYAPAFPLVVWDIAGSL